MVTVVPLFFSSLPNSSNLKNKLSDILATIWSQFFLHSCLSKVKMNIHVDVSNSLCNHHFFSTPKRETALDSKKVPVLNSILLLFTPVSKYRVVPFSLSTKVAQVINYVAAGEEMTYSSFRQRAWPGTPNFRLGPPHESFGLWGSLAEKM